jgi:long-subunit acyl-CoA synthetase (AMP-forming)
MQSAEERLTYSQYIKKVCFMVARFMLLPDQYFVLSISSPIDYTAAYLAITLTGKIACLLPEGNLVPDKLKNARILYDCDVENLCNIPPVKVEDIPIIDADSPCTIAFSSGTSAKAKGIVLSQTNLLLNTQYCLRRCRYWRGERLVHVLPYNHLFGIVADLLAPMHAGSGIFVVDSPLHFFQGMKSFEPDCVCIPPALADTICNALETSSSIVSITGGRLKKIICAGASLSYTTAEKLLFYGILPCTAYGLTECSPCVSVTGDDDVRLGTAGKPIECVEVCIADDGEILVRGRTVMLQYLDDENNTCERIQNGWFHTNDIGYIDTSGHLVVTGRKDNLLILANGTKLMPEMVERCIIETGHIDECLLSTSKEGSNAILTIVTRDETLNTKAQIDFVMQQAGLFPYTLIAQSNKLDRNMMGKVIRQV